MIAKQMCFRFNCNVDFFITLTQVYLLHLYLLPLVPGELGLEAFTFQLGGKDTLPAAPTRLLVELNETFGH